MERMELRPAVAPAEAQTLVARAAELAAAVKVAKPETALAAPAEVGAEVVAVALVLRCPPCSVLRLALLLDQYFAAMRRSPGSFRSSSRLDRAYPGWLVSLRQHLDRWT
jgi:hypothetical protein